MYIIMKILSYIVSLFPLYLLFCFQYFCTSSLRTQILLICFFIYLIIFVVTWHIIHKRLQMTQHPIKILKVKTNNQVYLNYFMTYIIPFVFVSFDSYNWAINLRSIIILFFILSVIWSLYCKTNLFSSNPIIPLLWWRFYDAEIQIGNNKEECVLLTRKDRKSFNELSDTKGIYLVDDEVFLILK